jgi:NitT/TauT family transport system substrate-binding protein
MNLRVSYSKTDCFVRIKKSVCCCGLLLLLGACQNTNTNELKIKVVALNGPSALSLMPLMEEARKDTSVYWSTEVLSDPDQAKIKMVQAEAEWVIVPFNMAALLYNKGCDYQLVAVPIWGTLFMAGFDSITSWNQLKGRTIHAMGKGLTPDIVLRVLLQKNGLRPDTDVFIDYSFPGHVELSMAAAAGKTPLSLLAEPMLSVAMEKNPALHIIFNLANEWNASFSNRYPLAQGALMVKRSYAEKNPEQVKDFTARYRKSLQWTVTHADEAAKLSVKLGLMPSVISAQNAIPRCGLNFVVADSAKNQIYKVLQIYLTQNPMVIGGKMPDNGFIYK